MEETEQLLLNQCRISLTWILNSDEHDSAG